MKFLDKPYKNILFTLLVAGINTLVLIYSGIMDNSGMAILALLWIPTIFAVVILGIYGLANMFRYSKASWITLILNIVVILYFVVNVVREIM